MIKILATLFFMLSTAVAVANETAGDKCMSMETVNNMISVNVPGSQWKEFKDPDVIKRAARLYKSMPPETTEEVLVDTVRLYLAPSGEMLIVLSYKGITCHRLATPATVTQGILNMLLGTSI
jgi:hypothetical protein